MIYLYDQIIENDMVIMVIPVYSAAPPSTYFAFRERSQVLFMNDTFCKKYGNVKRRYIVIGNIQSGVLDALNTLYSELEDDNEKDEILLIQSTVYNKKSIEGRLIELSEVRDCLVDFVNSSYDKLDT